MAIALLIIGIMLVLVGIQGTQATLGTLIKQDFGSQTGSFWYYILGIFIIGALGYYGPAQTVSRLFILLLLLVLMLSNQGFFAQLQSAFGSTSAGTTGGSLAPGANGTGPGGNNSGPGGS